jgi:hypothetical protein
MHKPGSASLVPSKPSNRTVTPIGTSPLKVNKLAGKCIHQLSNIYACSNG